MSAYKFLISTVLFILSIALFCLLNTVLGFFVTLHTVYSFAATLLFYMLLEKPARTILKKFIGKNYFSRISKTQETLTLLNSELNRALRYQKVTRILFKSFQALFPNIPYAFYIREDGRFRLQSQQLIEDKEILLRDIKLDEVSDISGDEMRIGLKKLNLPKAFKKKLAKADLTALLPFQGRVQLFAFLLIQPEAIPFWKEKEAVKRMHTIQNKAGVILENTALFADLEQKNKETKHLIEISNQILSSFEITKTLDFILKALSSVAAYDAAVIYLLDKSGKRLLRASSTGYDPAVMENLYLKIGQGSCGWVAETKQIAVIDDVTQTEHYYMLRKETRSQVSIPLIHANEVVGILCLESSRPAFFNATAVDKLQLFARLAAIAIFNARQIKSLIDKRALENDLISAGIVQKKLLVQRFPSVDKLKVNAVNIPSKFMSGDLYDIIRYNEKTIGVAIGDVAGKGAPASLMMSLILAGLRTQKKSFLNTCDLVYRLNNLVAETTVEGKYATFFYGVFSLEQNKLIFTNAGHNPPFLIKADGTIVRLEKGGIVLGFLPDWEYLQDEVDWNPEDIFIAYTDGITEAMNSAGEEFGEERLTALVLQNRSLNVFDIKNTILSAVKEFSGKDAQDDDMTLVICKNE